MKKIITFFLLGFSIVVVTLSILWFNTQPAWPVHQTVGKEAMKKLPVMNRKVIEFIEAKGPSVAPTYNSAVCTEFVIKVIDSVTPLTKTERNDIRIITDSELDSLIEIDSPIIKGVHTALLRGNKGAEIIENDKVLPGDFVQFWNVFYGKAYGHCGVVLDIVPNETLTLYSSHPFTGGYGTQRYLWPDRIYVVRLK
jgi:hypothetical protein